ncbi:methyltransferase domain-containing protein [Undibacterium sp. CY18W]|uniref:Methyltransferase domain-containing protein n=1 Tax=Undibacterium hunanense TaxID=2762292 RepID=A0ABR6ZY52_9BURK|nr:class I SAM-dependent methyltransferase [Undibacterium hunanense]MBC3920797.1 methyltransferase domain-containing protein [Undibacterium hunanense]
MKNQDKWQASKYIYKKGSLMASRDPAEVGVGSRLIADLIAACYDRNLRLYTGGRLLDLGCGKVPLFMSYKDLVTENICVDWANSQHKNEYLDFECDLSKALPFADAEFNTIILSDVLEHLPEPESLWKEMTRILAADGKIIMNVPFFYCLHEQPHDYHRFTEHALRHLVAKSGLRLLRLEAIGGSPEILADFLAKHLQFVPVLGKAMAIAIQYSVQLFLKTGIGKKVSAKTSQAFPLGYFMVVEKSAADSA